MQVRLTRQSSHLLLLVIKAIVKLFFGNWPPQYNWVN